MVITPTLRTVSGAALAGALLFVSAPHATADQVRDDQWALDRLHAEPVWNITKGEGQVVAVIDDGVDADHPDLKGSVLDGKDFLDGGAPSPAKGDSHGTAMASIIAGHGHGPGGAQGVMGLAPEAKVLAIRADTGIAQAIRYAVNHGATVVNISLGGDEAGDPDAVNAAIAYALQKNVPIVAAAGNDGGPVEYPAAYSGVVAVAGTDEDGDVWASSNSGKETLLSAPAVHIVSAGDSKSGYVLGTGTSDAAAYTSAAVALLKSKFPDLSAGQIVNRLAETAVVPGSSDHEEYRDERWGYGAIRPLAALTADIPKGSKWGPLAVPTAIKDKAADEAEKKRDQAESDRMQAQADRKAVIIWSVIGVVVLTVIAVVVFLIINSRRRKNRNGGPGGSAAPGGYPASYPPHQVPGYGYPPHQQQPMPPQHSAPPRQPPYN